MARPTGIAFELAHGDQKLLDIGIALVLKPTLLLLDEPTAGMSPDERRDPALIKKLWKEFDLTLVFIEHDMDMVFGIAEVVRPAAGRAAGRGNARTDPRQQTGDHRLPGRRFLMESILKAVGLNTFYDRSHILFDVSIEVVPGRPFA